MPVEALELSDLKPVDLSDLQPDISSVSISDLKPVDLSELKPISQQRFTGNELGTPPVPKPQPPAALRGGSELPTSVMQESMGMAPLFEQPQTVQQKQSVNQTVAEQNAVRAALGKRWGLPAYTPSKATGTPATQDTAGMGLTPEQQKQFESGMQVAGKENEHLAGAFYNAATGLIGPESLATIIGAEFGTAGLEAVANSPKIVAAISQLPNSQAILKAVAVASKNAIPAAFTANASQAAYQAARQGNVDEAVANAVFAATGLLGIKGSAERVAGEFPPAVTPEAQAAAAKVGGIATPKVAPGEAAAAATQLKARGQNLAAKAWENLDRSAGIPFKVAGQDVVLQPPQPTTKADGTRGEDYHSITDADGNVIYGGSSEAVRNWINQKGGKRLRGLESITDKMLGPAAVAMAPAETLQAVQATIPAPPAAAQPAGAVEVTPGAVFETPTGKRTVTGLKGGNVLFEQELADGSKVAKRLPLATFQKMVATAAPAATAPEVPKPFKELGAEPTGPVGPEVKAEAIDDLKPATEPEKAPAPSEAKEEVIQPKTTEAVPEAAGAPEKPSKPEEKQEVKEELPRQKTMQPEVAATLAPGSTRVNPDGTMEVLKEVDLSKIRPAEPTKERPQGNVIYPDVVQRYVENPSPVAPELRPGPNGTFLTWEGHHRIEAAKERGEATTLAWLPAPKQPPVVQPGPDQSGKESAENETRAESSQEPRAPQPVRVGSGGGEVLPLPAQVGVGVSKPAGPEESGVPAVQQANGNQAPAAAQPALTPTKPADAFRMKGPQLQDLADKGDTGAQAELDRRRAKKGIVTTPVETKPTQVETKAPEPETKPAEEKSSLDRFMEVYEKKLRESMAKDPKKYAYPASEVPAVMGRLRAALDKGTYAMSPSIAAAAKELGAKPTMAGIKEFLKSSSSGPVGPRQEAKRPEYLHTFPGEANTEAVVYRMDRGGFAAALRDKDADKIVNGSITIYPDQPAAIAAARKLVKAPAQKSEDLKNQFTGAVQTEHLTKDELDQVAEILKKPEEKPPVVQRGPDKEEKRPHTPAESEVLRILARGPKDEFSIPEYLATSNDFSEKEMRDAMTALIQMGDVKRIQMPDGTTGYQRTTKPRTAQAPKIEPAGEPNVTPISELEPAGEGAPLPKVEQSDLTKGQIALADKILERLQAGNPIGNNAQFQAIADEAFGGSRAAGKYDMKQAYDAIEAAVNRYVSDSIGPDLLTSDYKYAIDKLRELMASLPTQNIRSEQQELLQQFSTPPTLSYISARAAGIKASDVVLEPSAGTGSLASWAKAAGAIVKGNEIDPQRAELLRYAVRGSNPTNADAEFLNATLPQDIKPTLVIMNPPFSATGGRLSANKNVYGYRHVTEALKRLQPGGRLVAILGEGATLTAPTARQLWQQVRDLGTIRANIGISGKEYAKYGTTFGNRLVIIDKVPAPQGKPQSPVTGDFPNVESAYAAIADIANDRPILGEQKPSTEAVAQPDRGVFQPTGERPGVFGERGGKPGTAAPVQTPATVQKGRPTEESRPVPREEPKPTVEVEQTSGPSAGNVSDSGESAVEPLRPDDRVALEARKQEDLLERTEDDSSYVEYVPTLAGLAHPGRLVETKVMASVQPPPITYRPNLPANASAPKPLSAAQMESVARAGMMHEQFDEAGFRLGFLLGDGTGVGKGQQLAAIVWDRNRSGQKRAVWLSASKALQNDAKRDFLGIGAKDLAEKLKSINEYNAAEKIDAKEGVIFSTYNTLISKAKGEKGQTRLDQLKEWLGPEGVIIFDEGHRAKNAVAGGARQVQSKTGAAVVKLQDDLPEAYVVYASATSATDVNNLGYMNRLGLWGKGTAFHGGFTHFMGEIGRGGVAAMEMISREMKALGRYTSRSISYKGVSYEEGIHNLTPEQRHTYDTAARWWQEVLKAAKQQIKDNNAQGSGAVGEFSQAFWGEHQRFFRKLLTAMKLPTVMDLADKAIAEGKSVVISLIGTGQAQADQAIAEGADEDDLDFSPKESLIRMVRQSYPTVLYEEFEDEQGNVRKRPVVRDGKVLENPEAVAKRDALIANLEKELKLPDNPLDFLIRSYGRDKVAELTGRKKTVERNAQSGKWESVTRAPEGVSMDKINEHEMAQFQAGKKKIAVISKAAATGISLHADLTAKNQTPRLHIVMELSWSADDQMQSFGRTHRSNQKQPPEYIIVSTDAGGERRFSSTIARRLESLGALTKGQRDASGGGSVLAKYNFETEQGVQAAQAFYRHLLDDDPAIGTTSGHKILDQMGVLKQKTNAQGDPVGEPYMDREDMTNITRLLNRILNVQMGNQNAVYDYFISVFDSVVQRAIEAGTLDTGVNLVRGDKIKLVSAKPIATDEQSGAQTFHYVVEAQRKTEPLPVSKLKSVTGRMYKRREFKGADQPEQMAWVRKSNVPITTRGGAVEDAVNLEYPVRTSNKPDRLAQSELDQAWEPVEGANDLQEAQRLREAISAQEKRIEQYKDTTYVEYYKKDLKKLEEERKDLNQKIRVAKDGQWDLWQQSIDAAPRAVKEQIHMIGGSVMRIWSNLNVGQGRMDIRIAYPEDGGSVTGVVMSEGDAARVERTLTGEKVERSPHSVFDAALKGKEAFDLAGGIRLVQTKINRGPAIQVMTRDRNVQQFLDEIGVKKEKVSWDWRYYIPSDQKAGVPVLEKLLKQYPLIEPEDEQEDGVAQAGPGNPERGAAPILSDLINAGLETARGGNYSIPGAVESATTRGLGQIKRASSAVHEAALRAASPEARSAAIIRASMPLLRKTLEGSDVSVESLFLYYVDSRLQALRDMWADMADQARNIPDEQMAKDFEEGGEDGTMSQDFVDTLDALQGKKDIPENPAQVATAMVEQKKWPELKEYLANVFDTASRGVEPAMEPEEFEYMHDLVQNDPQVKRADEIYHENIETPINENHALNEGVFTDRLGPAGRYFPLLPAGEGHKPTFFERIGFKKPKNSRNVMATGLSRTGYTVGVEKFRKALDRDLAQGGRAALIQAAYDANLMKKVPRRGNVDTDVFRYRGEEFPAKKVTITPPRMVVQNGRSFHTKAVQVYMPQWFYDEVKDVLDKQGRQEPGVFRKALEAINTLALQGPADITFHSANIVGALIGNTPFLSSSLGGMAASSNMMSKKIQALMMLASVDPTEQEAVSAFQEMADAGALPTRYATQTYSPALAEATGAKLVGPKAKTMNPFVKLALSPMLYGPKGIDARARYIMWKIANGINPNVSAKELNEFVNQLGNYTPALWSELEKRVKSMPFSPFFTAGSTMIRNGVNAMFSSGPVVAPAAGGRPPWVPKNKFQMRLWHALTVGTLGTLALWFSLSKAATGKYPWQDKRSKFLALPVGGGTGPIDKFRHTGLGNKLWGPGSEVGYLNLYTFNPLYRRGAMAMGIPGAYEALMEGATSGQAGEAAQKDVINTLLHPVMGPEPRALFTGITGKEMYLTSLRDRQGNLGPNFLPAIPSKTKPGLQTNLHKAAAAAMELNAATQMFGEMAGVHGEEQKHDTGAAWLHDILDMSVVLTGAAGRATNPYARAEALRRQRAPTK